MSEWFSYSPDDFLLFSPRVYFRLLELHNGEVWPAHVVALMAGLALLVVALRRTANASQILGVILGLVWLWVAWSFLWQRYSTINWAVAYVAPVFAVQGLALIAAGLRGKLTPAWAGGGATSGAAVALLVAAVIGYPTLAAVFGRGWAGAEVFGIMPDPTALATLAVLLLAWQVPKSLLALPIVWLLFSSGVLHLLEAPDRFVPVAGALVAVVLAMLRAKTTALPLSSSG